MHTLGMPEGTVGQRCTNDRTCDRNHSGLNFCSDDGSFSAGTLYPQPLCLGRICTPADTLSEAASCDEGLGVCVATGSLTGVCLPKCTYDGTGAAPVGCPDRDPCTPYAWTSDGKGVGYCTPGCLADTDCTNGDRCQMDQGACVTKSFPRTYPVGHACSPSSNPPEVECNCMFAPNGGDGYCTQFCLVDDARTTCPDGFVCSAALPASTFTKEPTDAAGNCLKTCATDADCISINAICIDTPHGKLCVPGVRPGADAGVDADAAD